MNRNSFIIVPNSDYTVSLRDRLFKLYNLLHDPDLEEDEFDQLEIELKDIYDKLASLDCVI